MLDILNTFIFSLKTSLDKSDIIKNLNFYKSASWILALSIIAVFVIMYLFIAFGLLRKMKDRFMGKRFLAFIPIYQFVILSKFTKSESIMSIKKNKFILLLVSTLLVGFLLDLITDLVYYNKILKLMFKNHKKDDYAISEYLYTGDTNYFLNYFSWLINLFNSVLFIFFIFDYMRYNTKSPIGVSVLCIFFGFMFPILVFTTRKNPVMDYKVNPYVYNGGRTNSNGNQNSTFNGTYKSEEPFAEFSDKKEQPFSEFESKNTKESQNAGDFYSNENTNKNDNSSDDSSDDDMFN